MYSIKKINKKSDLIFLMKQIERNCPQIWFNLNSTACNKSFSPWQNHLLPFFYNTDYIIYLINKRVCHSNQCNFDISVLIYHQMNKRYYLPSISICHTMFFWHPFDIHNVEMTLNGREKNVFYWWGFVLLTLIQ